MVKDHRLHIRHCYFVTVTFIFFLPLLVSQAVAFTDPDDVIALEDLYLALNKPPQLTGWKLEGDPCQESWTGVSCSGSSLLNLTLQGLNLSGYLGTHLHYLHNLKHLDVSSNYILGDIPYGLPPNATTINLACNNLSQNIPHSLSSIKVLRHLNLSHNFLSGPIGNMFAGLSNLEEMDLSYNELTGDLPPSFGYLTNLTRLFLQNNKFTGSVIYVADLPLTDLNIQSNHFSGVIPPQFQSIPNLWIDGNRFHIGTDYPPWSYPQLVNVTIRQNFSGPSTTEASVLENLPKPRAAGHKKKRLGPGGIALVVGLTTFAVASAAIFFTVRVKQSYPITGTRGDCSPAAYDLSPQLLPVKSPPALGLNLMTPSCRTRNEQVSRRRSFAKKYKAPASAKIYTVGELQSATNSFSEDNLIGEGSLGSVYKAEFPDGQILAVRNISMVSLSFQEEEQFLDVIWTATRLRHPNIVTLLGYCVEHGQHLLVYEYIKCLSLDIVLHGEADRLLPWTVRLNIALGVAQALDYLHSFYPPIVHGNIKAANVLLDEELKPRLCDCGIAILRPLTSNSVKLKASEIAVGDTGYIAPEHGEPGADNTKSDVYAFGVLLLELLTGRKPFDRLRYREEQSLVKWASSRLHDSAYLAQMVDTGIKRTLTSKTLSQFADIVSLCIQPEKLFRPPMSEIVESLASIVQKFSCSVDGAEVDPFEKSFRTTHSCLISSPAASFYSS